MKKMVFCTSICMLLLFCSLPPSSAHPSEICENDDPDLHCFGDIIWTDVTPGTIVKNVFYIENIGGPISELDWEITEWPEWGVWYFLPPSGENLKPNDGATHVYVFVEVPDMSYQNYEGNITIVNSENTSDCEIIPIALSTPLNDETPTFPFIERILQRFPFIAQIVRRLHTI